jgi:hypothetical protein
MIVQFENLLPWACNPFIIRAIVPRTHWFRRGLDNGESDMAVTGG